MSAGRFRLLARDFLTLVIKKCNPFLVIFPVFGSLQRFPEFLPSCFPSASPVKSDAGGGGLDEINAKDHRRLVDTLRPDGTGRDVFAWDAGDGALKGFGVRVKPSGIASYFVQYRNQEGRTRRLVLGRVGELTPDDARSLAADEAQGSAEGRGPLRPIHAARSAMTVAELCDLYLADAEGRIKPSTFAMDRSRIECHVKPLIGRRAGAALVRRDIERLQADIAAGKTAKPRKGRAGKANGGRGVAARTVGIFGTIFGIYKRQ